LLLASKNLTNWLLGSAVLLALLIIGRPLLIPLVFALLLWAILNALADTLHRLKLPMWLAWTGSLALIVLAILFMARVIISEANELAAQAPVYMAKLDELVASWLAFLRIDGNVTDLFDRASVAGIVGVAATSAGGFLFTLVEILIYVGFLLAEQSYLPGKIAQLQTTVSGQDETKEVFRAIAKQLRSYLGIATVVSAIMAAACYALLTYLGVAFAGAWSLVMFVLAYVPTIGVAGVIFPALMALLQFGTFGTPLLIVAVLGAIHFLLKNIIETDILRRTLNLSPFAIILSLTFWGLIWGAAGLFLAVPMTGGIAIVCSHIDGIRWISVLLAAPPPRPRRKRRILDFKARARDAAE
jgi:predicted PurR-regulated permease PerM